MLLTLFGMLLAVSLVLITLGLYKPEHTELSLIGFVFLFLLSIHIILGTGLTYQTGQIETYSYDNTTLANITITDSYSPITLGGNLDHLFGYYLAVLSVIGFLGVMTSYKRQTWRNDEL